MDEMMLIGCRTPGAGETMLSISRRIYKQTHSVHLVYMFNIISDNTEFATVFENT